MNSSPLNIVLPLTLAGSVVRLEPVRREHGELFWEIAKNDLEDIFRWIPYSMKAPEDFRRLIDRVLNSTRGLRRNKNGELVAGIDTGDGWNRFVR